ncbi:ABC-2 type transport system ATP-binding protein [Quadrisphaera granulorum]|uniref:ABC-2 type transport system ATP-binding protein n=2 Tax=Quadrisphaera granulorum TaxID=317664 RepID=A0A316AA65_9ACTN|nr:ABC-2 type transport system ATP-binding protein [Quadrisphaera granulorum]SZE96027.1 ABC-2 type transport system ATP-binding protein [Quadrisphaera granulorum]
MARLLAMGGALVVAVGALTAGAQPSTTTEGVREQVFSIPVGPEPDGQQVTIDATLYEPASATADSPAPAVLLAHGFGGSKADLAGQARTLAADGYAVVAWTARGFGASGGMVHLDSPDYEVADARVLVDLLAERPEVLQDAPGDPRVGIAGSSYGGAVGLLLAGTDPRIDAVASAITWSDLSTALDPQAAQGQPGGVFKAGWTSQLLTSLTGSALTNGGALNGSAGACGRLDPDLCRDYLEAAETGVVPQSLRDELARSAPAAVLPNTRAAVLLVQGEGDSLFGLDASAANAAAAQRAGVPVSLAWVSGGHDGGFDGAAFNARTAAWFDEHLRAGSGSGSASGEATGSSPLTAPFSVAVPQQSLFGGRGGGGQNGGQGGGSAPAERTLETVPPLGGTGQRLALAPVSPSGQRQDASQQGPTVVLSPAGGRPAAMTALPGLGDVASLVGLAAGGGFSTAVLPGQAAVFETEPLEQPLTLLGASSVRLSVTSNTDDAVLFASLSDVSPDGSTALPSGLVAPLRVQTKPGQPTTVDVTLPAVVRDVAAGHRLRLVVASTDSAYAVPADPRVYSIALASADGTAGGGQLSVASAPAEAGTRSGDSLDVPWAHVLTLAGVVVAALALALVDAARRRRRPSGPVEPASDPDNQRDDQPDDVVLQVNDLEKVYGDGFRAVDGVSFTVRRGQVVGLLGPNGAGKTTTLRMLMGLLRPSAGSLEVLGQRVRPGSPVLARVGALVEGPGFLPHLSGLANLRLFWASTGRPAADARFEEALEVAGLGDAVHRRVRGYSQGMRQRLGIAQAMLGFPDLLVLDEPTNGLDPPQITAMRQVLRDYAATGRTVLVSSHLLSEVEATCSHAVVMARGKVLAAGSVAELVAGSGEVLVSVGEGQVDQAVAVLRDVLDRDDDGGRVLGVRDGGVLVAPGASGTGGLVAALVASGVQVDLVVPQRHLEEVFLELVAAP